MSENGGILYGTLSIPQTYHVNREHDDKSLNFGALKIFRQTHIDNLHQFTFDFNVCPVCFFQLNHRCYDVKNHNFAMKNRSGYIHHRPWTITYKCYSYKVL